MTKQETARFVAAMRALYPGAYAKMTQNEMKIMVDTWSEVFKEVPAEAVEKALHTYSRENETPFPPAPPQLFAIINREVSKKARNRLLTKYEAWDTVQHVLSHTDFKYDAQEAFDSLPKSIQKAVGSARTLREWAYMDISNMSYIKRDFLECYQDIANSIEEDLSSYQYTISHIDNGVKKLNGGEEG